MLKSMLMRVALLLALLIPAAPLRADQSTLCLPTSGTVSGLTIVTGVNAALKALATSSAGSTAPENDCTEAPVEGQWWLDTAGAYPLTKIFDGTQFEVTGTLDESTGIFMPPIGGGAASLASAATVNLWSVPQGYLTITGTTTITKLAGTGEVIGSIKAVAFAGALTLTHNATQLIMPGAQSRTTAAGDKALVVALGGGNVAVLAYSPASGAASFSQNLVLSGVITPSSITGSNNDWAPTGISTATVIRANATTSATLTGLLAQSSGTWIVLQNINSSTSITLADASTSSTAANRFSLGADYVLGPQAAVTLRYDGTLSRWVAIASYRPAATQSQATTGTDTTSFMTPQRTLQAIQTGYRWLQRDTFTSSGSYAVPSGARYLHVLMVAGGGGGGGADNTDADASAAGSGGGGGEAAEFWLAVSAVTSPVTVTIGSGGSGGSASGGDGGDGGDTSFGAHATVNGGAGGNGIATAGYSAGSGSAGGSGGSGPSGVVLSGGGSGGASAVGDGGAGAQTIAAQSGIGGASTFGGGGFSVWERSGCSDGGAGLPYGSAGGGGAAAACTSGGSGGAGKSGLMIIDAFN